MYASDELVAISALQHLIYCERQAALIHVERLWAENRLTVEGMQLHRNAHDGRSVTRADVRTVRTLELASFRLGLIGVADVVEFIGGENSTTPTAYPIEYKRGKPKKGDEDRVQLCAQALCLEEMLEISVPVGAIFYGSIRRRDEIQIDSRLRHRTEQAAARLHEMIRTGTTPPARYEKRKCDRCSLRNLCLPTSPRQRGTMRYVHNAVTAGLGDGGSNT